FFFSSRRRHTRFSRDWSSDVCSSDLEMVRKGKDPARINPLIPVDLIIDHSVQVDYFGSKDAYVRNVEREYERNSERYRFLKWARSEERRVGKDSRSRWSSDEQIKSEA